MPAICSDNSQASRCAMKPPLEYPITYTRLGSILCLEAASGEHRTQVSYVVESRAVKVAASVGGIPELLARPVGRAFWRCVDELARLGHRTKAQRLFEHRARGSVAMQEQKERRGDVGIDAVRDAHLEGSGGDQTQLLWGWWSQGDGRRSGRCRRSRGAGSWGRCGRCRACRSAQGAAEDVWLAAEEPEGAGVLGPRSQRAAAASKATQDKHRAKDDFIGGPNLGRTDVFKRISTRRSGAGMSRAQGGELATNRRVVWPCFQRLQHEAARCTLVTIRVLDEARLYRMAPRTSPAGFMANPRWQAARALS